MIIVSSRMSRWLLLLTAIVAIAGSRSPSASATTVWREGERPDAADVQPHGWYNSVQKDLLSDGDWLSHFGDNEGTASYQLQIPAAGDYAIWLRANPTGARLSWRLDRGDWQQAPLDRAQHQVNVAEGGAVDIRFLAWVKLAQRQLAAGQHTLELRLHSENRNHGAIDAIFLNDEGLVPVGKGNPAVEGKQHAEGFFAWSPGRDPLSDQSPIDLRYLNQAVAGEDGFVRREGDGFQLGDGQEVRFWAVQDGLGDDPQQYDRRARRLAKYGINLVRMGGGEFFRSWRNDPEAFRRRLDDLHAKVAALKKQGIYTYIDHLYWHTHHEIDESVFPGFGDGENAIALMFFSDRFQQLYLRFLADLMQAENARTGSAMAADPAVAFLEIQNESSLLFYTFKPDSFPESERRLVETQFAEWLTKKHGSLDAAQAAWGDDPRAGNPTPDAFDQGRVGLYSAAMLTGESWARQQRNEARASDQLQFMVESQKGFYEMMTRRLREELGLQQVIVPSNWKTADPRVLDGLERYSYTGADVVCRNSYFSVDYKQGGEQKFYQIEEGDTYREHSALKAPGRPSPLGTPMIAGFPFMVTENNWTRPNRYRVEWPLMVATYGRMTGADGWTFFAMEDVDWRHAMGVGDLSNPSMLGQFPAAALMFRRGDVRQPEQPAVHEFVSLDDAYRFAGTQAVPLRGEDALWRARLGDREGAAADSETSVHPLAYFVGPVVQEFGSGPARVRSVDLREYIDAEKKRVRSVTGELHWDAARGVMAVNTPRAQGAWGFLGEAGVIRLGDVAIEAENDYGAVVVVSLDNQPIATSKRLLIQTGTWDRPYGFETQADGEYQRITKLGGYPLNVRNVKAQVALDRPVSQAVILDGNGYPTDGTAPLRQEAGRTIIQLPEDSLYTIVQ